MQIAYELKWLDYLKFTLAHQFCSVVAQCFFIGISAALAWQAADAAPALAAVAIYAGLWAVQAHSQRSTCGSARILHC